MGSEHIYSDRLVEITEDSILFKNYYFPLGSRRVDFSEVDKIVTRAPKSAEKWRIHGTLDLLIWFPRDWRKPSRDHNIFHEFSPPP